MSRLPTVSCMLGLALVGCAGSRRARLDAHGIALAGDGSEASVAGETSAADTVGGGRTTVEGVVADHALEQRLRRELRERRAAGGTSALELIEPGATVESRLRFALSRQQLDREAEATAALVAVTREVPNCALAHLLLGQARLAGGDAAAAVASLRRARSIERELGQEPHPALGYLLGSALLRTDEADEGMQLLRAELASGTYRADAAELLAQVHGDAGDFESALASVDAVLDDVPDEPGLVIVKAGLLGDCLRVDEALKLLDVRGGRIAQPLLLFHRALLERQRGRGQEALRLLDQILAVHGDDPTVQAAVANIRAARQEVQSELQGTGRTHRERELLGILRFAPQPAERARAVRALCANGRIEVVPATVRWALRDEHEAVRIAALQVGTGRCANSGELLEVGLQDAAAGVRAAAAVCAVRLPDRAGLTAVVAAIGRERDPDAFLTLHRALVAITGREVALPFGGERDPEQRDHVIAAWRDEVDRLTKSAGKDKERRGS
ncbi:MAG: tetratricopeptide repeat protein [Planctomycetota bacterium]